MIELVKITSGYGKRAVLDSLSLNVNKGEVLSLVGPNGAGKSTLLKSVSGVLPLLSGDILIDKKRISTLSKKEIALKCAYLPQESTVPDMTVFEFVLQGRYPHVGIFGGYGSREREAVERVVSEMGLHSLKNQKMSSLSGGMRRRVDVASALVGETDYILLDEPCAFLDVRAQLELMEVLKKLAHTFGKGIAAVMHDISFAMNTSDIIAVMKNGKIILSDTPKNVFESGVIGDVFEIGLEADENNNYYSLYKIKE